MDLDVRRLADPAAFLDAAGPLLLEEEARHNLILGLAATLRDEPDRYPDYRLWTVSDAGEVVGAALRTLPFNLVLARPGTDAALDALAAAIEEEPPGVVGALPEVESFARLWSARRDVPIRRKLTMGLYALESVQAPTAVSGRMRPAMQEDRTLVLAWWRAFAVEALGEQEPDEERLQRDVDHRLASRASGLVLWEDGGPVSLAGFGGETPNGIRIGPVYTPPELRSRGYASALVAELSASLLEGGRRFCFLYTDQANPTSNRIYRRIGYELVCESAELAFDVPSA